MEIRSECEWEGGAYEEVNLEAWEDVDATETSESIEPMKTNGKTRIADGLALASFGGLALGAATLGRVAQRRSPARWYRMLRKAPFQPPPSVFGPVWTALYGLIATSGYRVWKAPPSKARTRALALWGAQLALNGAWSPLFFKAHRRRAALLDLLALVGVVAAYAGTSRKVDRPAAAMMIPYLAWLGFAGILNQESVRRNRGLLRWLRR